MARGLAPIGHGLAGLRVLSLRDLAAGSVRVRGRVVAEAFVRNEALLVLALALVGTILPVALSTLAGTLVIPRDDDWSFRRTALGLWSTGHLAFDGVAAMMLIGQIVLVQPFLALTGGSPAAFAMFGILVSGLATVATYALSRQFVSPARSFVVAMSLLLFPGYLAYSTSFMTDAPALAAQMAALALGVRALASSRPSIKLLALAMAIAVVGFSIRQFGLAVVAAIALAAIGRWPRRPSAMGVAIGGVAACLLLQLVRSRLPGEVEAFPPQLWFATRLPMAAASMALMVLPAAVVAMVTNRRAWRLHDAVYGAAFGLAFAVPIVASWLRLGTFPDALVGNLTTRVGAEDFLDFSGLRPVLFTDASWTTINLVGVLSIVVVAACLGATLGTRLRDGRAGSHRILGQARTQAGLVATFVVVYGVGLAAYGLTQIVFDRYLWPIVPAAALLLVIPVAPSVRSGTPPEPQWGRAFRPTTLVPLAVMTLTAILSVTLMLNAFAFDSARWRAGQELAAIGLRPDTIDAGYEWTGFHATTPAHMTKPIPTTPTYRGWWPEGTVCAVVSGSSVAPPDSRLVGIERYRLYLFAGPAVNLYLYRGEGPGCGTEG